jgi:outer membrane lipoprotein-sorting protein
MKKLFLTAACLIAVVAVSAQSLDEIVKKYTAANKMDQLSALKTIRITAKISMMGMDMPMELWMKNPNKIKTVTNISGQEMINAFDGEKGWQVNPMTGSTDPQEMTPDQVKQTQGNNMFQNQIQDFFNKGQLTLIGEESVNGNPAFKLKAVQEGGIETTIFIDKASYLLTKSSANVNQGGQVMTVDSYPSDYKDINGLIVPMKTTSSTAGMDFVITFTKVEVNIPMEDSVFKLK